MYQLRSARYIASDCLSRVIRPGDHVIDATMGNGHDTCLLAELVGENGHVAGFDLQLAAVKATRARLHEAGLNLRCSLFAIGHERIAEVVSEPIRAAVFNLGWLPGGDKSITTKWETTHTAVEACMKLLLPGGVITICVYPGHEAGEEERFALAEWLSQVPPQEFTVLYHYFLNAGANAPECIIIQKNLPETKA